jgi:hypothetical protein
MISKANNPDKQWEQNRSWLFEYANSNKNKDKFSDHLFSVMSDCELSSDCIAKKKHQSSVKKSSPKVIDAHKLGLRNFDIVSLVQTFPGQWVSSVSCFNNHAPDNSAQSTSLRSIVFAEPTSDNLVDLRIYDPMANPESSRDILCHGCLQAHSAHYYPNRISKKSVDSITGSISSLNTHEFHATHKDYVNKPGRSKNQAEKENQAALWSTLVQTAYEAPFSDNRQDWKCATERALMGMQYLSATEAKDVVEALDLYFNDLADSADMNALIRSYQQQVKQINCKVLSNHIAQLFAEMHDAGLKNFFNRWIKHLELDTDPILPSAITHRHVPSLRVGMAINDAKELGANLATSLRIEDASPIDKRAVLNDLRTSIRRFNNIWQDLDKKEQKYLRPKLLQIVHTSIQ